jgi:hypothetical protein
VFIHRVLGDPFDDFCAKYDDQTAIKMPFLKNGWYNYYFARL